MPKAVKTSSGKYKCRVFDYKDIDGKKHYKAFTADTKKEAEYLASIYKVKTNNSYDITLKEAYDRYLDSKKNILSPSTYRGYLVDRDSRFQSLMPLKISKLTQEMIQREVNIMSLSLSPKSIRNSHGLLHAVLNIYRPGFVLKTNLGQKEGAKGYIPSTEEINKLLELADDRIRVPILLASQGGLRVSEICALDPKFDFNDDGVTITKAKVENADRKWVIKKPKTDAGYRFTPLSKQVIEECKAWKYAGMNPKSLQNSFRKLRNEAQIPTSMHKLRHYWASELHYRGLPDKIICEYGGWETPAVLQKIYQHALKEHKDESSKKIIEIFNSNFNNSKKSQTNKGCG